MRVLLFSARCSTAADSARVEAAVRTVLRRSSGSIDLASSSSVTSSSSFGRLLNMGQRGGGTQGVEGGMGGMGGGGRCGRDEEVTGIARPSNAEGSHFGQRDHSAARWNLCPSSRPPLRCFTSTLNHCLSYVRVSSPRESSQRVSPTPFATFYRRSTGKLPTLRFSWRLNAKLAANNVDNAGGPL